MFWRKPKKKRGKENGSEIVDHAFSRALVEKNYLCTDPTETR